MCFSLSEIPIIFFFFYKCFWSPTIDKQYFWTTYKRVCCVVLVPLAYEILVINIIIKLCPHFFSVEQNISMFDDAKRYLNKLQGFDF